MTTMDIDKLVIRSFSPDQDISPLSSLYSAVEAADRDGYEMTEQALRAQLALPGHDPLHDRWVVANPDGSATLIATGVVSVAPDSSLAEANVIVHPDWRRCGIGSSLLAKIIDRSHQLEAASIQIYANARHPAAPAFLHKHGFISQGAYTELRLTTDAHLPPVIWPYGYTMSPYSEVQDLSILTQAMNLSYIPLWGHHETNENEIASWLTNWNYSSLFLVFSEKGRVVGISRVELSPERTQKNDAPTGYIDAPGIVPQHRRLDLFRALVLTGIRWLHDQGQSVVEMESWGDKLEVLKMYRELGFKDMRQLVCYQIDFPPGGQAE